MSRHTCAQKDCRRLLCRVGSRATYEEFEGDGRYNRGTKKEHQQGCIDVLSNDLLITLSIFAAANVLDEPNGRAENCANVGHSQVSEIEDSDGGRRRHAAGGDSCLIVNKADRSGR